MTTYARRRVYRVGTPAHYRCAVPNCRATEASTNGVGPWGFRVGERIIALNLCGQHGAWLEKLLS